VVADGRWLAYAEDGVYLVRPAGTRVCGGSSRTGGTDCEDGVVGVEPLRVVAAAILEQRKVLLVSTRAAPDVFYLPGGKPDDGEPPLVTLARELREELGVVLLDSQPLAVVTDQAALERTPMEMHVYLATIDGTAAAQAEIAQLAWAGAAGTVPGRLAPAIRNHVLPTLAARGLIG
jgi:8-oxo-dGTP diphosphatase